MLIVFFGFLVLAFLALVVITELQKTNPCLTHITGCLYDTVKGNGVVMPATLINVVTLLLVIIAATLIVYTALTLLSLYNARRVNNARSNLRAYLAQWEESVRADQAARNAMIGQFDIELDPADQAELAELRKLIDWRAVTDDPGLKCP